MVCHRVLRLCQPSSSKLAIAAVVSATRADESVMTAEGARIYSSFESSSAIGEAESSIQPIPFLRGMGVGASKLIIVGYDVQVHSTEEIDDGEPGIINMFLQQIIEGGVRRLV